MPSSRRSVAHTDSRMPTPAPQYRSRRSVMSSTYSSKPSAEKISVVQTATMDSGTILPAPAVHFVGSAAARRAKSRKARISEPATRGIRRHWDRLLNKFGSGTAPSASSVDLDTDSVGEGSAAFDVRHRGEKSLDDTDVVDEVVVEREWGEDIRASSDHSDHAGDKTVSHQYTSGGLVDRESMAAHDERAWGGHPALTFLRYRMWPAILRFFVIQFMDEKSEEQYRKESWFMRKNLALWSAAYYIFNWVLSVVFIPKPIQLADKIFHYGIAPTFSFPIFFMVLYDFPRDRPILYQTVLTFSTWMYGIYQILFMFMCAYYGHHKAIMSCGSKDFLATFYYANGPQTIALFGLGLQRFPALIGTLTFMSLCFGMIVPSRTTWVRNVINFICFQAFLLYTHYMRENAERRLYTLRDQLKIQFRATQKAQVNERKTADSKRRLTSYVFHEVRVPLNTALLAVQNMAASGMVAKSQEIEFKALEGSLSMMSKVLNDVLDFNRMDSGRFESVLRPYTFHQVMRSLFVPLRMATEARGLSFVTDLDKCIDEISRRAMYEAMGMGGDEILKRLTEYPDEDGIVVGDETRLRQIITNLASNACKFTPAGGKLMINTRLILPHHNPSLCAGSDTAAGTETLKEAKDSTATSTPSSEYKELGDGKSHQTLSSNHLARHNSIHSKPSALEWIVVRIEVTDTGCGIKPQDMVQSKLFSPFNQTELGRQQGGKGTGLGLALVRQIVKLSGGRLGLQSKPGQGSTFWVELPLGVGAKAEPWSTTPQFFPQNDHHLQGVDLLGQGHSHLDTHRAHGVPQRLPKVSLPRSTSAMHTIMDQGGMVEISADGSDNGKVVTRTLGDISTGTDPTPTVPLTTPDSSPIPPFPQPPLVGEQPSDVTVRPQYVELPSPRRFSLEEAFNERHNGVQGSPIHTPSGSAHSSIPGWEAGLRVLVVDDDPLTRKLMARMLTRFGCKVSTAENGDIAMELILGTHVRMTPSSEETGSGGLSVEAGSTPGVDEYKYSVIFLDNQMPVMSGLDVVSRLREMGRSDFVVGVTGNALLADQQEYLEAGADHVLTKPVFEKSLKAMLTLADERRRLGTPMFESSNPCAPT